MKPSTNPFLSIIIPAHNEEDRLGDSLSKILEFTNKQAYTTEILVVENGSTDRTFEIAKGYEKTGINLGAIHLEASGKGVAVRTGILAAKGEYRFICDSDLSMPIEEVNNFFLPKLTNVDVAIASREAKGAIRYDEPMYRHLVGRVFNFMVRMLVLPGLNDTQCGFKCFSAKAAEAIFPLQTMEGWSFDVEILAIARAKGFSIVEVPIHWYYGTGSRLRVLKDSFKMGMDLFKIRRNLRRGKYKQ